MSYALIAVKAPPVETQNTLSKLGRSAKILEDSGYTLVQDEVLGSQYDLEQLYSGKESDLEKLGRELSSALHTTTFAVLNFDNDILAFFAYSSGERIGQYNSSPNYLACSTTPPVAENVEELATLFGKPDSARGITQLLGRKKGLGFTNERQRHEQLADLLGLPRSSVVYSGSR
jgi:hypothetical protein